MGAPEVTASPVAPMQITKLEAARRQMDTAIELYFNDGDPVSIHTLVGAARSLVTDLSAASGYEPILRRYIKPEHRWKVEGALRAPQNFFKHADKDPDNALDFSPQQAELLLLVEIPTYQSLAGSRSRAMQIFWSYAAATWARDALLPPTVNAELIATVDDVGTWPKRDFFRLSMEILKEEDR